MSHDILIMIFDGNDRTERDGLADQIQEFLKNKGYNKFLPRLYFQIIGGPKQPDITIGPEEGNSSTIIIKVFPA